MHLSVARGRSAHAIAVVVRCVAMCRLSIGGTCQFWGVVIDNFRGDVRSTWDEPAKVTGVFLTTLTKSVVRI